MPHFPKPFFRENRGLWYVQIGGRQINLGAEKEAAFRRYHELMALPKEAAPVLPVEAVAVLIDRFLDWCKLHRASRCYDWYRERCQSFLDSLAVKTLLVSDLRPYHVQQWVDAKGWSDGMQRGAIVAVQRAFNWAVKLGHIAASPIARMEKPRQGQRDLIISPVQFTQLLSLVHDKPFKDLLTFAWETGRDPKN